MTKFLADENIPPAVVRFLRDRGFDVKEVREAGLPGASDDVILSLAREEGRVLLTLDKHFTNILVYPPGSHHGIIRIRIHPPLIEDIVNALNRLFQKSDIGMMRGSLIILECEGFRVRRAPE
jgi:predicted nuclease of predicted toxin-antitoxin system